MTEDNQTHECGPGCKCWREGYEKAQAYFTPEIEKYMSKLLNLDQAYGLLKSEHFKLTEQLKKMKQAPAYLCDYEVSE